MQTIILAFLLAAVALADDLYPRCVGTEISGKARGGSEVVLSPGTSKGRALVVECIAFEVRSLSPSGVCEVPHETLLPFRVLVRAKGTNADNTPYESEFDLRDTVGGSINRLTINTPVDASFELVFGNKNANADCMMAARAIFTTSMPAEAADGLLPAVVNLDPRTAYADSNTFFVFRHQQPSHPDASAFLLPIEERCMSGSSNKKALTKVTDAASLAKYTAPFGQMAAYYSVWSVSAPKADNYKVCAKGNADDSAAEIALLTVFGGNPMYFVVTDGATRDGRIYTGVPITVRFHGSNLDTRPNHDAAKLVDEAATCDASPSGGVPQAVDLGPADTYGKNAIISTWTFSIRTDGGFKVCYRRFGGGWVEVPNVDDLPKGAVDAPTPAPTPAPVPTNPRTQERCPLAAARAAPKYAQSYLKLVFTGNKVPSFFRTLVGETLCVPQSALIFERISTTDTGAAVLYLDILCDGRSCGSQDRKNYLLQIADAKTKEFTELGAATVEEVSTNGILTLVDHTVPSERITKRKGLLFIIACITLIAIAGIVTYGVVQFRKNQHHFIQFGIDEDDDLEIDEPPPPQTRGADATKSAV